MNVKMNGSILEEKSSYKMPALSVSSKLDLGCYIVSIAETISKKIGTLIRSMKVLSPEVALYLYESTIYPCMKLICRTLDLSLAACLVPLAHRRNVANLSLFYRYYCGRCSYQYHIYVSYQYNMSVSIVSFHTQLDSGILCPQNAFLWPMI